MIQASEPGRWGGAGVDAPRTPRGTEDEGDAAAAGGAAPQDGEAAGSTPDDEARRIRAGTRLEGGACGTYAVAATTGLLVYPTLQFERAPPSAAEGGLEQLEGDLEALLRKHRRKSKAGVEAHPLARSEPDDYIAALAAAASADDDGDAGLLTASLTFSDDEDAFEAEDDVGGAATVTATAARVHVLPFRRVMSNQTPLRDITGDETPRASRRHGGGGLARHFSQGGNPSLSGREDGDVDEFHWPLLRLKYGDRVQVVGTDARGWVKLARGHGYVRLENDKQLVKGSCFVWGTGLFVSRQHEITVLVAIIRLHSRRSHRQGLSSRGQAARALGGSRSSKGRTDEARAPRCRAHDRPPVLPPCFRV